MDHLNQRFRACLYSGLIVLGTILGEGQIYSDEPPSIGSLEKIEIKVRESDFKEERQNKNLERKILSNGSEFLGKIKYINGIQYFDSDAEIDRMKIIVGRNRKVAILQENDSIISLIEGETPFITDSIKFYKHKEDKENKIDADHGIAFENYTKDDGVKFIFRNKSKIFEDFKENQEIAFQLTKGEEKNHCAYLSIKRKNMHIHGNIQIFNGKYKFDNIWKENNGDLLMEEVDERKGLYVYPIIIDPCQPTKSFIEYENSDKDFVPIFKKRKDPNEKEKEWSFKF